MAQGSLFIVVGLILLTVAADRFVVAAARLSRLWGVSPVLIGALVVGMGTSAPEFLVGILAALDGELDLALGNVVGSNVANVTLVLGVTALVRPIEGNPGVLRREGILTLIGAVLLTGALHDLEVQRWEGVALALGMALAAILLIRWARDDQARVAQLANDVDEALGDAETSVGRELVYGIAAMALTLLGAELLVEGGVAVATGFGFSAAFIGMTLVAVGTSLPELATAIAGARRGENELVVGNILGSNLFNTFAVAGVAGSIHPSGVDSHFWHAAMAMVGAAVISGFFALTGMKIVRWEGLVLLVGFVVFVGVIR